MGAIVPIRPLSPEARVLADDPAHVGLARALARRLGRAVPWLRDDLESAALLGLCRAAVDFDPARGLRFSTYAVPRVAGAIKDEMRASVPKGFRRRAGDAPRVVPLSALDPDAAHPDPFPSGELPVGWEVEAEDAVRGLACGLGPRQREVVVRLYCHADTATMAATGRAIGLSDMRISQIHSDALELIRERDGIGGPVAETGGGVELDEHGPGTNGVTVADDGLARVSAGNCPDCGKPFGKIRRCFACKPTTPKATVTPRPAAPAPVAADRPDDPLRELDAMRAVVAALDGLDPAAAARVLGWVSGRVRGEGR